MRFSPAITLVASVVIGGVALVGARGWLSPSKADAIVVSDVPEVKEPETLSVVVAKRAIPRGATIDETRLEVQQWPAEDVPEGSFRSVYAIGSTEYATRRALMPIDAGKPILDAALTAVGVRPTLAARLEPGFRAFTLRMTDVTGVGGFVLPGDRIDVLFTWDQTPESRQQTLITEVLLQDVEVLGLDLNDDLAEEDPETFKTATIAVKVEDAQKLSLAAQTGTLAFVLRGIEDREIGEFKNIVMSNKPLNQKAGPAPQTRVAARSTSVKIDVLAGENVLAFDVPKGE